MNHLGIPLGAALILFGLASASAQTANAPAPTGAAGGASQTQQFPSGGTAAPNGAASPTAGKPQIGAPTAVEQQEQQQSDKAMTICKGC